MATAIQKMGEVRVITPCVNAVAEVHPLVPLVRLEPSRVSEIGGRRGEYRCACGQWLRVFGLGRHQVYFEPGSARLKDPRIAHVCPGCGGGLPGNNPD